VSFVRLLEIEFRWIINPVDFCNSLHTNAFDVSMHYKKLKPK